MSQFTGRPTASAAGQTPWERPAAADDIVDPIEIGPGATATELLDEEQSDEEAEDVPLNVKLTDALSMLADGGHDYGSRPVIEEELSVEDEPLDTVVIDESSKDA